MNTHKVLLAMLSIFCLLALCAGIIGCDGIFAPNETTPATTSPETTTPNETLPNETTPSFGEGYTVVEGLVVKTNDGYFILPDGNSPSWIQDCTFIKMRTTFAEIDLSNLQTGDRIKIAIETIMERYPVQTEVYQFAFIDKSGNVDDIPETIITELGNLNYTVIE